MSLKTDLENYCGDVFRSAWTTRDGTVVPGEDSKLGLKGASNNVIFHPNDASTEKARALRAVAGDP